MGINNKGLLLVANWDSGVGYAWWLMESFWVVLSETYSQTHRSYIAYPSISTIPDNIKNSSISLEISDFTKKNIADVFRQCKLIINNKIKIIYFSDQSFWHWRYLLFRLCGVDSIIVHDHTPGIRTKPKGLKKLIKSLIARTPYITCDGVIAASNYLKLRAIEISCIPEQKVYVATNGLKNEKQENNLNIKKLLDIPEDKIVIITTGRAIDYKGIPFAINCIEYLIKTLKCTSIHWVFFGDGPNFNDYQKRIETSGLTSYISFPGKYAHIKNILRSCDFAFHPSQGEVGYSLSILEYMQAGLPVIVSDNPSVCGATNNKSNGLIYKEHNIDSACNAIISLIHNEHLIEKYGDRAKIDAKQYSLNNTHKQLKSAFISIENTANR